MKTTPFDDSFLVPSVFLQRTRRTLTWLQGSIAVHGGRGSAAWRSWWFRPHRRGWELPYPETTGYLIETLLDYQPYFPDMSLTREARTCADWLCDIQLPSGAWMSGLAHSQKESIFNTAQILFGMVRSYQTFGDAHYLASLRKGALWLASVTEADGAWHAGAYIPGHSPAYYSRAIWGLALANTLLTDPVIEDAVARLLDYYSGYAQPDGTFRDWGFRPNEAAFTHTIAYTIRGFWEAHRLTAHARSAEVAMRAVQHIAQITFEQGKIAGSYRDNWLADHRFMCVTGHFQLALTLSRIFEDTGETRLFHAARRIFSEALPHQRQDGGIPGSAPSRGAYMPLKQPNWAAKFFLDAYLKLYTLHHNSRG